MQPIRKNADIPKIEFIKCHDGEGTLFCQSLLDGMDSTCFPFMHNDTIPAGVSIGEHTHTGSEEIYYLVSGKATLLYDGEAYEMLPGDISICLNGHSHGMIAHEECRMIVIESKTK